MVEGKNSEVLHDGQRYHIQTEMLDVNSKFLMSQVFLNGQVVYQKKHEIKEDTNQEIDFLHSYVINNIKEMMI